MITVLFIVNFIDRLELSHFSATFIGTPKPMYQGKALPPFYGSYSQVVELNNKQTSKVRIIACENPQIAEEVTNLINLSHNFLTYLHNIEKKDQQQKTGPSFINHWVQEYQRHKGVMEFDQEVLDGQNLAYLISFGRNNQCIKHLIFNQNISFQNYDPEEQVLEILSEFSKISINKITFFNNYLHDNALNSVINHLNRYDKLTHLEISNNALENQSLVKITNLMMNCNNLQKIILNNNLFGSGSNETDSIDIFLKHLCVDLDNPEYLDLSNNQFSDESIYYFVKYIFANDESKLIYFNLENNKFSPRGQRTLLKAYSLSTKRNKLQFKLGPLQFTEGNLKHAFNFPSNDSKVTMKQKEFELKFSRTPIKDALEITISRKPNYGQQALKGLPMSKGEREALYGLFSKIDYYYANKHNIYIEDIRDLLAEITNLSFEFPRHRLEPIFEMVNDKINDSIYCENLYCLEVLRECLMYMNARNIKAEEKYQELAQRAIMISKDILKVINMEITENDNQLNKMLDKALSEAKKIGMRGQILDTAFLIQRYRDNLLNEMQTTGYSSDENEEGLYNSDQTLDVYDEKYRKYIGQSAEELGMTTEVEHNLGFHPYDTNYLKICKLNLNYIRKNQKEAQRFFREEDSYAYQNIYDRCTFLLCNCSENQNSTNQYNRAKNDSLLKIARIIFRYRNCLDQLYPYKSEPQIFSNQMNLKSRKSALFQPRADENMIYTYKNLVNREYLEFNNTKLHHPVTALDKTKSPHAVTFNKNLYNICEGDDTTKTSLYVRYNQQYLQFKIQELFEDFIVKKSKLINEDLYDEFYLQIFRQINRKKNFTNERANKAVSNAIFVLSLFSRYATPSDDLIEGYQAWLYSFRDKLGADYHRFINYILDNFELAKKNENASRPFIDWAPCFAEIESLITGQSISINIYTPIGESLTYNVDVSTTVETLLESKIWKEKFFSKEPDPELYWLYKYQDAMDQFDIPLPKDKRILKLMYKQEKEEMINNRQSDELRSSTTVAKKKYTKIQRRETTIGQVDLQLDNEYQSAIFIVKKRMFSSLHFNNIRVLSKKSMAYLFYQVKNDYISKNLLRRQSSYDDVSFLAALILQIKYWGKILRSKDNLEQAIPPTFLREKNTEFWVQKIKNEYDKKTIKELTVDACQEKFLSHFANHPLSYSSYYIIQSVKNPQLNLIEENKSDENASVSASSVPFDFFQPYSTNTQNEILMVVNFKGVFFYDNIKRDKVILSLQYEDLLHIIGQGNQFKIGFILKQKDKVHFQNEEFVCVKNARGRSVAEDIVTYCQLILAETKQNEFIEIIKKNITDIPEDYDPLQSDDDISPSHFNRQFSLQRSKLGQRASMMGKQNLVDSLFAFEQGNLSQNQGKQGQSMVGYQFKLKEQFLIYLKKYPLYVAKLTPDQEKQSRFTYKKTHLRENSGQLSNQKIEEANYEDEDEEYNPRTSSEVISNFSNHLSAAGKNRKQTENLSSFNSKHNLQKQYSEQFTHKPPTFQKNEEKNQSLTPMNQRKTLIKQEEEKKPQKSEQNKKNLSISSKVTSPKIEKSDSASSLKTPVSSQYKQESLQLPPRKYSKALNENKNIYEVKEVPESDSSFAASLNISKVNFKELDKTQKKEALDSKLNLALKNMPKFS